MLVGVGVVVEVVELLLVGVGVVVELLLVGIGVVVKLLLVATGVVVELLQWNSNCSSASRVTLGANVRFLMLNCPVP